MSWEGQTNFTRISVGTQIHVVETISIVGVPARPLEKGAKLPIQTSRGGWIRTTVIDVRNDEADIELADGSMWRMSHHRPGEQTVSITSGSMNSQDWVVREKIR